MNNKLLNIFNKDIDVHNMIKSFLKRNETIQDLQGRSGSLSDIDLSKNKLHLNEIRATNCDPISVQFLIKFAAILNDNRFYCPALSSTHRLHLAHDIHTLGHLTEYHVTTVQPLGFSRADEELRTVRVLSGVRHR